MELVFVNGTDVQKQAVRTVAHGLLNMPFEAIGLVHTIEFVPDPSAGLHNEFAITQYTYDDNEPLTKIASVAPNWGEPWRGIPFLHETYAHELGHGFYAALPEEMRIAIAQMFGAETDDLAVLSPSGVAWEDQIIEGIAETFKDAFLPRRLRRYANRTRKKIPIYQYPEFRGLWRNAAPQVLVGGEPLGEGEEEVEGYSLDIFKEGGYRKTEQGEPSAEPPIGHDWVQYLLGDGGFWDTLFLESYLWNGSEWVLSGSAIKSEFRFEAWVKDGTILKWELPLPLVPFEDNGSAVDLEIGWGGGFKLFFKGTWIRADESESGFTLIKDAVGFLPPTTVIDSVTVNKANFGSKTLKCHGETYRFVEIRGILELDLFPHTLNEHEALREALFYPILAPFPFTQAKCSDDGEPGPPVEVLNGQLEPEAISRGVHRVPHRIATSHFEG